MFDETKHISSDGSADTAIVKFVTRNDAWDIAPGPGKFCKI